MFNIHRFKTAPRPNVRITARRRRRKAIWFAMGGIVIAVAVLVLVWKGGERRPGHLSVDPTTPAQAIPTPEPIAEANPEPIVAPKPVTPPPAPAKSLPATPPAHPQSWDGPILYRSPGSPPMDLILVEKDTQTLRLYRYDGRYTLIKTYPCGTGSKRGAKTREHDEKTPEGIYFNTKTYRDTKITVFGDRAFQLDYPNPFDNLAGNGGHGIFLHGSNRPVEPYSTNGCVALDTPKLADLDARVDIHRTPIIIGKRLPYRFAPPDRSLEPVLPVLKQAMVPKSLRQSHPAFDSITVIGYRNTRMAVGRIRLGPDKGEAVSRLFLAAPDDDMFVLIRREWAKAEKRPPMTASLNPVPERSSATRTTATEATKAPAAATASSAKTPTAAPAKTPVLASAKTVAPPVNVPAAASPKNPVASAKKPVSPSRAKTSPPRATAASTEAHIRALVESWRQAWEKERLDRYIGFYHPAFEGKHKDLAQWKEYKRSVFRKFRDISVAFSTVLIRIHAHRVRVYLRERYRCNAFRSEGYKVLEFRKSGGNWKIYREWSYPNKPWYWPKK